jgi:hypothetical protein
MNKMTDSDFADFMLEYDVSTLVRRDFQVFSPNHPNEQICVSSNKIYRKVILKPEIKSL